jgi:hypothetical protein
VEFMADSKLGREGVDDSYAGNRWGRGEHDQKLTGRRLV